MQRELRMSRTFSRAPRAARNIAAELAPAGANQLNAGDTSLWRLAQQRDAIDQGALR